MSRRTNSLLNPMTSSKALLLVALVNCAFGWSQFVNITGKISCTANDNGDFFKTTAELWEYDWIDPNDKLDSTEIASDGSYHLSGVNNEYFSIEPFLIITHYCNFGVLNIGCEKTTTIYLPKNMTSGDKNAKARVFSFSLIDHASTTEVGKCPPVTIAAPEEQKQETTPVPIKQQTTAAPQKQKTTPLSSKEKRKARARRSSIGEELADLRNEIEAEIHLVPASLEKSSEQVTTLTPTLPKKKEAEGQQQLNDNLHS